MKKILLLGLLGLMGLWGFQAQGQTVCPEGYSTVDTMLNGSSNNANTPFGSTNYYHVTWSIYSRQELEAIGITPGSQLREIGYSLYSPNGHTVYNVEIYLKEVPLQAIATMADSVPLSEMTLVSSIAQVDFVHGWNYLTLDSTFTYTGYGHLMVAVKREGTASGVTTNTRNFTVMAGKTVRRYRSTQNAYNTVNSLYAMRAAIAFRTCTPPWDCTAPAIASLRSEGNSVRVVLTGGAAERQVALVPTGGSPDDSTALWVNATSDTVLVDSLDSWTTYDVYARSLCGGFPSQWSTHQSVKTHCGVQPVPYDAYLTQANTDSCWVLYNVLLYSNYVFSNDSTTFSYAVLPEMDLPINRLHVQFRYTLQAGRSMVLGVMTDAYDTATFIPYDTLTAEYNRSNDFYDFDLNRWTGPEGRLAFRWTVGQLRRVQVDTVFGCYTPSTLTVSDVTTTSVRLAWNNRSTSVTGYEVNLVEGTQYLNPTLFSTDSMGMVLDSLQPSTYYSVQVRTRCGEGNTVSPDGVSQWSGWKQFRTDCVTVSALPYRLTNSQLGLPDGTNFAAPCWEYVPDVSGFSYWVLPEFDTNNIRMDQLKITLSLRYNSDAPDVIGLGVVDGVSTLSSNFAQIGQISMPGFSNYNVSSGERVFYCNLRQGKRLAFRMLGNKIQTIDSIVVEQMACPPVRDIVLTASTDTSMTFNWTEQGTATQWLVSLTSQDGTYQQTFTATAKPFTVGGLTAYTKYRVEVRALNNGDASEACQKWLHTSPDALHTLVQVGVGDGSASTSSGSFNYPVYRASKHSWQQMLYPLSTQGKAGWIDTVWFYCKSRYNSDEAHDTSLTLYLGHADTTVTGTTYDWVQMAALTQVYHTDNWRASATGWVPIVLDTPFLYNGTDALAVVFSHSAEYTRSSGDQYAYLSMTNGFTTRSNGNYPAYAEHPGYYGGTRENTLPVARFSMMAHTCAPVTNVTATRLGIDTVQLSWTERGTASQWQVEYSADSILLTDTLVSGTPQLTLAGLPLDHTYRFRVRPVCAAGDTGYYSGYTTIILRTPIPPVDTLTVTSTSLSVHPEVPIDGTYADYGFLVEFIYPASLLAGMEGSVIRGVQFHCARPSFFLEETFTLAMQEVADSTCTIAGWRHDSTALQVWTGSITIEDSLWTVWFDTPYNYGGGHLLFRSATDGLTGGSYLSYGFQCLNAGDTAGRYQHANVQHQLMESQIYTTPYLPVIDFFYNLNSNYCHRPQHLVADSVWGTGATMNWDSMPGATGYQWTLTNEGQTVDSGTTTATTVSVGGLTFFDTYTFGVSTLCDSGDVSGATMVTFTAQNPLNCDGTTPPYFETFEGVTPVAWNTTGQSSLPLCWQMAYNGTNASIHQPTVVSSYQYMSDLPNQALLMNAGNTSGYATWVQATLPLFTEPLSSLALALDYRYENTNQGRLVAGWYNDSTDLFYTLDTLTPHAGSYLRDTVYFDAVTAPMGARMALRWIHPNSWYAVAVDNIEVFIDNGIPAPEMLTVENVTATCATIRWSEVDTATAYRIVLNGAMNIDTMVTDTTLTLCNLEDDADYTVAVMPLVGSEAGRSASATFHTLMLCAPLANVSISPEGIISWQYDTLVAEQTPAGVEIEIIDQQGMVLVQTDTAYFSPYVPAGLTPGHTYSFAVRTLCASATANTADTVVMQVTPSVCVEAASNTIPSNSHFMDNFWESNYSQVIYPASFAAGIDTLYGIALRVAQYEPYSWQTTSGTCRYDIYVGQTNGTHTSPLTSDSLTMVVNNKHYSLSGTGWKNFLFSTPYLYDGMGDLVVTIVSRQSNTVYNPVYGVHTDATCTHFVQDEDHTSGQINPSTFNFNWEVNSNIPDIRLLGGCGGSVNTCLAPEVEVAAVDTHSVSLQWQQRGSESLWQVEYRPVDSDAWQLADTTSATSFTITGLAQATHYVVRVGSVCSDSLVAYSFPDSATTLCGYMELPYTISFLADEYPCWTLGSNSYHNNWNGVSLSEWNTNGYIISPEVNANIADLRATITSLRPVAESYESRFAVGVCDADGSNVTWIDTIGFLQQNTVQTNEVHFNHYSGSGRYIIFRGVEGICNIRQFTLEAFAGCVPVHDVTVDNIGEHSAQLTWVPELATNTWAVYLDGSLVATTTSPSYTLTGLASNTQYTVGVREICSLGDTSTVVTRMFQTLCDAFALPYFEEFDQAPEIGSEHILTDCWVLHAAGNYATAYCIGDQWSYTCLSFDDSFEGYDVINYLSSPRLTVGSGGALVAFKGQTSYFDTFTVGIMLSPYDTSTFIPVRDITLSSGGMAWYSFSTDTIAGAPTSGTFTVAFRFNGEHGSGIIDSLTVTANPVVEYTLTLAVNDTAMGTVSGGGTYEEGTVVTVTAEPNEGYHFVMWSDSVTTATRQVILRDNDITLTAYFAADSTPVIPDTVWRTVTVNAVMNDGSHYDGLGEMVHGAGTYADGSTVTLEGEVHGCGISLVYWITSEGDTVYDNPYTFVIHSDVSLTAVFAAFGGIGDVEGADFRLYPNPASTTVTVIVGTQRAASAGDITILDLQGREVRTQRAVSLQTDIDVSDLPRGVYFVRVGGAVKKLVVR